MDVELFSSRSHKVSNLFNFRIAKVVEKIRTSIGMGRVGFCEILGLNTDHYDQILRGEANFELVHLLSLSEEMGISTNLIFSGDIDYSVLTSRFFTGRANLPERYLVEGQQLARVRTVKGVISYLDQSMRQGYVEKILNRLQVMPAHFVDPDAYISPLFIQDLLNELHFDGFEEQDIKKMGIATMMAAKHTPLAMNIAKQKSWREVYRMAGEEFIGHFDHIWEYKMTSLKSDHCIVEVRPRVEMQDLFRDHQIGNRAICLCRQGVTISISGFLERGFVELEELRCMSLIHDDLCELFSDSKDFYQRTRSICLNKKPIKSELLITRDSRVYKRDYQYNEGMNGEAYHIWIYRNVADDSAQELLHDLFSRLIHEIKTPLAIAHGHSSCLKRLAQKSMNDLIDHKLDSNLVFQYTNKIIAASERLNDLLSNYLSFDSEVKKNIQYRVDVEQSISEVLLLLEDQLIAKKIELRRLIHSASLFVAAQPLHVAQVLTNLISNAIDAVRLKPDPFIEIEVTRNVLHSANFVIFRVSNNGEKIPDIHFEKIFSPYFSTKPSALGMGLGLSISRDLARKNGGDLVLDSTSDKTSFVFSLPAAE
jgi:signal transduction histidine kinase